MPGLRSSAWRGDPLPARRALVRSRTKNLARRATEHAKEGWPRRALARPVRGGSAPLHKRRAPPRISTTTRPTADGATCAASASAAICGTTASSTGSGAGSPAPAVLRSAICFWGSTPNSAAQSPWPGMAGRRCRTADTGLTATEQTGPPFGAPEREAGFDALQMLRHALRRLPYSWRT
jgi:hypothetical protein